MQLYMNTNKAFGVAQIPSVVLLESLPPIDQRFLGLEHLNIHTRGRRKAARSKPTLLEKSSQQGAVLRFGHFNMGANVRYASVY
jgi:hypothetical protein